MTAHPNEEPAMTQQPRTIQPDDAQDERLAALPLSAAYTYAYIPTVLDDDGRAAYQPAVFNGYLWPLRIDEHPTDAMTADLEALIEADVLCRYTVDGHDYLHDPAWRTRQKISRPVRSSLPRCPQHDVSFDDVVAGAVGKVSEQVNAFVAAAASNMDETRIRDTVTRLVEDATFLVDPEKAMSYGQKVRELLGDVMPKPPTRLRPVIRPDVRPDIRPRPRTDSGDTWSEATDDLPPQGPADQ
jgi:hypothetical protein